MPRTWSSAGRSVRCKKAGWQILLPAAQCLHRESELFPGASAGPKDISAFGGNSHYFSCLRKKIPNLWLRRYA